MGKFSKGHKYFPIITQETRDKVGALRSGENNPMFGKKRTDMELLFAKNVITG